MIIILENVRDTLEKGKDLFINIFYLMGAPIREKKIKEGFL